MKKTVFSFQHISLLGLFLLVGGIMARLCSSGEPALEFRDPPPIETLQLPVAEHHDAVQSMNQQFELRYDSVSDMLHTVLILGVDARVSNSHLAPRILDVLTDSRYWDDHFSGNEVFFTTRHGIRCADVTISFKSLNQSRQSHVDQAIGVFGEVGVPATFPITTRRGSGTVADLLRDSIANFSLDTNELEWTAVGYARYFSGSSGWVNKFGQRFTMGQLVDELISRYRRQAASCGGTHIVSALVFVMNSHRQCPLLADSEAQRLRGFLLACVEETVVAQNAAGGWQLGWNKPSHNVFSFDAKLDLEVELLVTGHTLEWLRILPPDLRPPREVFERGCSRALQILTLPGVLVASENYCQRTHAFRSVRELME